MSRTRTLGRYKLKSYASSEGFGSVPRSYAALVTHRDTGDHWMLVLNVDSLAACDAAIDLLTLAAVEQHASTSKPFRLP